MLVLAASWTVLAAVSLWIGSAVLGVAGEEAFERTGDRFVVAVWLGTLTLAIGLLAASVFAALVPLTGLLVAIALSLGALIVPNARTAMLESIRALNVWPLLGFTALTLGVAFFSSQKVTFYDTGLYHAGAIEWLSRYGSVKGLALLEYRLGFTSSWFALAAVFNEGPLAGRIGTLTGGYAMLLASLHFVISTTRLARGDGRLSDWFAALAYAIALVWLVRSGITISPSPDVPVIVVGIVVVWSIVKLAGDRPLSQVPSGSASHLLPAQAVTVLLSAGASSLKPSALPLFLIAGLFYLRSSRSILQFVIVCALSVLLVLPTALASLSTSGCPLFPAPVLCGHLPWSVSSADAAADQAIGRDFLRWTGPVPPDANSLNWLPHWAVGEPLGTLLIAYMVVASLALALLAIRRTGETSIWVIALAFIGVAYVLAFSPTYRFMFAYGVAPLAYLGAVVCARWRLHPLVLVPPILVGVASVELATTVDHTNALTRSAFAYALMAPVAAFAIGVGFFARTSIQGWKYLPVLMRGLQYPIVAVLVGLLFVSANLSLIPRPWSHRSVVNIDYVAALVAPPLLPTLPEDERIQHSVNDVTYIAPPPGLQVCWALIPCTVDAVPPDLHLLDPKRGIAGGFARR